MRTRRRPTESPHPAAAGRAETRSPMRALRRSQVLSKKGAVLLYIGNHLNPNHPRIKNFIPTIDKCTVGVDFMGDVDPSIGRSLDRPAIVDWLFGRLFTD